MLRIGIVGGAELSDTTDILKGIFSRGGLSSKSFSCSANNFAEFQNEFADELGIYEEKGHVIIEKIYIREDQGGRNETNRIDNNYNILILNGVGSDGLSINNNIIDEKSYIALNRDDENLYEFLEKFSSLPNFITYGLSSDACITVSSISDGAVQCCIRKPFLSISGKKIIQQEFGIKIDRPVEDIYSILAAAVAAIISDIDTLDLA